MTYMEKFKNDPITKKVIRGLVISTSSINNERMGISDELAAEKRKAMVKTRLMMEMSSNEEYLNTVMDAAFELLSEKVSGEIKWDESLELTAGEEFGKAIAKMMFGSLLK